MPRTMGGHSCTLNWHRLVRRAAANSYWPFVVLWACSSLFAGCIVIDNCCNHLQIGSLFYSDYPNSQFPFSSLAVNFFRISFSFDYIHCQGHWFNLIFFFLFLSILVTLNLSSLTFSLLYPRIRIVNRLNFFISCIDHKPLLVICHGQYY